MQKALAEVTALASQPAGENKKTEAALTPPAHLTKLERQLWSLQRRKDTLRKQGKNMPPKLQKKYDDVKLQVREEQKEKRKAERKLKWEQQKLETQRRKEEVCW